MSPVRLTLLGIIASVTAEISRADATPSFHLIPPEESGLTHICEVDVDHPMSRAYYVSSACGSVVAADFTGNGSPELFFTNGPGRNLLYVKEEGLSFREVTGESGINDRELWGVGAAAADVDNDGDLDLYICNYDAPNELWINVTAAGSIVPVFEERAAAWGLDIVDASVMPTFADYDRDGRIDVYLLTFRFFREGGRPPDGQVQIRLSDDGKSGEVIGEEARYYRYTGFSEESGHSFVEASRPDRLLRNIGDRFVDVTSSAGLPMNGNYGNSVTWWDWNRDGYPDIFVGNDFSDADLFYLNRGDGTFQQVLGSIAPSSAWRSMGSTVLDIDNNGWTEVMMGDMAATTHYKSKLFMGEMGQDLPKVMDKLPRQLPRNALYLNLGATRLLDAAHMSGVSSTDWTWAIQSDDFNQDGWQDLFVANGNVRQLTESDIQELYVGPQLIGKNLFDFYKDHPELREQNLAFSNQGDLTFDDVSALWGLDQVGMSYGAATADLDRDGDLDLIVTNLDEPPFLLENKVADGASIQIRLRGTKSNSYGIGSRIEIKAGDNTQVRELYTSGGFLSTDEPIAHFGVGDAEQVDRVEIQWPSGAVQIEENLKVGRLHTLEEPGEAPEEPIPFQLPVKPVMFTELVAPIGQLEEKHDDYATQPLLPKSHSQLGPGMAWGDVTGDGVSDLVYAGSKGNPTQVFRRERSENGGLKIFPVTSEAFEANRESEALGVLLLDAEGDGDQDLYVANGSVEADPGDESYQDKLFLNDGSGGFTEDPEALPALTDSSFSVVTADYDRDGDLDLAVASRIKPGQYPLAVSSRLLRNENGKFKDVTEEVIPNFIETGLVTSLLWTDINNDGWIDLMAAHEWGPIKVYINEEGQSLSGQTEEYGLGDLLGWWQGIQGRDLNGDGRIDYVATNFGTNTIYQASSKKPELLFYGDVKGTGKMNIIEAKFEGEICYPRRGFSCSSEAIPQLRKEITTFRQFARSSLEELYNLETLEPELRFECNTLESIALINTGEGSFTTVKLPWMAQVSPSFGVVLTDFDADGHTDAFLAQNFSQAQVETGPMNPGIGTLLKGTGKTSQPFAVVEPLDSGIVIPEDGRSVTICDLNEDGRPDLFVGLNDAHPSFFLNQTETGNPISIQLKGTTGNPTAIGAVVSLTVPGLPKQTTEIYGGSGYLSQSHSTLYFAGANTEEQEAKIEIRWPDGSSELKELEAGKVSHRFVAP